MAISLTVWENNTVVKKTWDDGYSSGVTGVHFLRSLSLVTMEGCGYSPLLSEDI